MKHKKISQKLILVLVLLILFNFFYPKRVSADIFGISWNDILSIPARIAIFLENGIIWGINVLLTPNSSSSTSNVVSEVTPENIIKGRFLLLNANIFEDPEVNKDKYIDGEKTYKLNGKELANQKGLLRTTIASWYYALRNFAIVALLCVLVYVGIRMIMSTIAQDKNKYKIMFKDWLVALCLVFAMHYIMITVLNLTQAITEAIGRRRKYRYNNSVFSKNKRYTCS